MQDVLDSRHPNAIVADVIPPKRLLSKVQGNRGAGRRRDGKKNVFYKRVRSTRKRKVRLTEGVVKHKEVGDIVGMNRRLTLLVLTNRSPFRLVNLEIKIVTAV